MSQFAEFEIVRLSEDIWLSTLNLVVHAHQQEEPEPAGRTVVGIIQISGDWQGTVALQMSRALATRVAQLMFQVQDAEPSEADLHDAVGEITNMTGGNIKALLEGVCHLSLPTVVEGTDYVFRVPGTHAITRVPFRCDGAPLIVSILAREMPAAVLTADDGHPAEAAL